MYSMCAFHLLWFGLSFSVFVFVRLDWNGMEMDHHTIVDLLVLPAGLTAEYYYFGALNFGGKGVMSCQFQWSSNILCRCVTYLVLIFLCTPSPMYR